ncbi:MAG: Holliday junction resolvase RuvX [Candidatus Firestonebacteria bacterium]
MRLIGLDIGTKRVGVAIADELGIMAHPFGTITYNGYKELYEKIKLIVDEHKIEKIIVGFPKNMNGSNSKYSDTVQNIISQLKKEIKISVDVIDERLSTVEAERILINADVSRKTRKNHIDKLAAILILQTYLDKIKYQK